MQQSDSQNLKLDTKGRAERHEFIVQPVLEIEKAILGSIMVSPSFDSLQDMTSIKERYFYSPQHRQIYRAILALLERGAMPDMMLVYQQDGAIDPVVLSEMCGAVCIPSQLPHYIRQLVENHRRRTLEHALYQAQTEVAAGMDREQIEDTLLSSLSRDRVQENTLGIADGFDVQQIISGQTSQAGVQSGLEELDLALSGGIMRAEMCIAAARTSVGKSALAIMWMLMAVFHGWPVLYLSFEMPRKQIFNRALSYWSRVSLRKFRQGSFDQHDCEQALYANKELKDFWPYIWVNCVANKPSDLHQLIRLEQLRSGPDIFVIIDHAGRMQTDHRAGNSYERMSTIANSLKDIAIDCNVPMLVLWQLSRAVEKDGRNDKKPNMADLRNSGEAEEVADEVILLSRDSYYDKGIDMRDAMVTVDVAKARDGGKLGPVQVSWQDIISRTREPGEEG